MEEVITTLGNAGSPSDYVYMVLRELVLLCIIGFVFVPSPGDKGSDVPLGLMSLRQPEA